MCQILQISEVSLKARLNERKSATYDTYRISMLLNLFEDKVVNTIKFWKCMDWKLSSYLSFHFEYCFLNRLAKISPSSFAPLAFTSTACLFIGNSCFTSFTVIIKCIGHHIRYFSLVIDMVDTLGRPMEFT